MKLISVVNLLLTAPGNCTLHNISPNPQLLLAILPVLMSLQHLPVRARALRNATPSSRDTIQRYSRTAGKTAQEIQRHGKNE